MNSKVLDEIYCYRFFKHIQFSSVVSDSLRPHESQHARPPCPTPGVHSDSRPSSQWCHPAISSSAVPSPPAPNPSQHQSLFQWVNSSHEVAKVLEFQLQHHSFQRNPRADLLQNGLLWCPCSSRDSQRVFVLQHHSSKASILQRSVFFTVQLSHPYTTTGKTIALTRRTFVGKVISLLFNMLSKGKAKIMVPTGVRLTWGGVTRCRVGGVGGRKCQGW